MTQKEREQPGERIFILYLEREREKERERERERKSGRKKVHEIEEKQREKKVR